MVVHIQDGKGGQDRDVMFSPVLLEELRAHWQRLRKKSVWLFPGNRWHSGDHFMDDKTPYNACVKAARCAGIKKRIYPHVLLMSLFVGDRDAMNRHWNGGRPAVNGVFISLVGCLSAHRQRRKRN